MVSSNTELEGESTGARIFTGGSFSLGVYTIADDIDAVCIIPNYVDRNKFTELFANSLKLEPNIKEIVSIPSAFVPIIKLKFNGVLIDLAVSKIDLPNVPEILNFANNEMFKGLDESQIRSINGPRVASEILRIVPQPEEYRNALRAIRLWAKCRGIYSNIMGFVGGVGWALMVAYISKNFPNASASELIWQFFRIYSEWKWPTPIELKTREFSNDESSAVVWNPFKNKTDCTHYMPVITPMYPAMCSTHNVSESSLAIIHSQFQNGYKTLQSIFEGTLLWSNLFLPFEFFQSYQYYLSVTAYCEEKNKIHQFSTLVESQLRYLCCVLESEETITVMHPYTTVYTKEYLDLPSREHIEYLKSQPPLAPPPVLSPPQESNTDQEAQKCQVYTTTFYLGLDFASSKFGSLESNGRKVVQIPTGPFLENIIADEFYDENIMSVSVKLHSVNNLPTHLNIKNSINSSKSANLGKGQGSRSGNEASGNHVNNQLQQQQSPSLSSAKRSIDELED
jgi:poly(A) polymerase